MAAQSSIEMMNDGDTKNWTKVGLLFYEIKEALVPIVESDWSFNKQKKKPASKVDIYHLLKFMNRNIQLYRIKGLKAAAKKVLLDRNKYVHDLERPQVTEKQLQEFKNDMMLFLQMVDRLRERDTTKTKLAMERIEEIFSQQYTIVEKDENNAKVSEFEARLLKFEFQINEGMRKLQNKVQVHEKELESIKNELRVDQAVGAKIKARFDKAEMALMKDSKDHGDKITMLESQVYEIQDRQGHLHNAVGYLLMREPDIQQRKRSEDHVNMLRNTADWNPVSECGEVELMSAANEDNLILVDLLITEGVPLNMKYIPLINSAKGLRHIIQHLQRRGIWDPASSFATDALEYALLYQIPELQYILVSNEVNVTASEYE